MNDLTEQQKAEALVKFSMQEMAKSIDDDVMNIIAGIVHKPEGEGEVEVSPYEKSIGRLLIAMAKSVEILITDPVVKFKKTDESIQLPHYETNGAAGADLRAYVGKDAIEVKPGQRALIPTGLSADIPYGYEIQVRPRSGWAAKFGITVLNSPGTIDSDYKGDIGVILHNTSDKPFYVNNGDRIAQIVVAKVVNANFMRTDDIGTSDRGEGGFGSTGAN